MSADLRSLRLFVAVAEHGSISEGAKRCHIALAAASKRMSDLEARARLPLLVRHARGVALTSAGHGFLLHARAVLSAMDRLDAELDDFQHGVTGVVSITANASAIAQFLPDQIGSFLRLHPVLKIDLQERASTEVVKAVSAGLADIGVIEGHTPAQGLECLPYRSDELAVVVGRDHPLARRKRIGVPELLRHDHIVVREGTALHRVLLAAAQEAQAPLKVRMQVGSFDMVCRMVEQGVGIGVLPFAAILPQLQVLRLRCLRLDAPWASRRHLLCVRREQDLTAAARSVLEHLRSPDGA
ncbi:LysR family transcriptional regulator [Variovorax sp. YR216]|uniref:LysR family transcriptional regulator n=1 Tax=Variovorax sp. YR216 TaxID=1882828 RepID=UPI000896BB37|nr:LysR family transcriptional regulator [Variovorax sp. YR216]SEA38583.1 DNA-binding transcriptional regulator, LysR family [Variovorax sp. YR216]